MKNIIVVFCFIIFSFNAMAQKPILLDDIHYYVSDSSVRDIAVNYFKTFFKGRSMAEQVMNPLPFIDLISLGSDEATFNISSPEPISSLKLAIKNPLFREKVKPSTSNLPIYGVRWVAFNTTNIRKTVRKLLKAGYGFAAENFTLPTEPEVNAVAMYGFDSNIIVLVERPNMKNMKTEFGIDHLQLLVNNLEDNVRFYQNVLAAEIIDKTDRSTVLKIGNQRFVLSEPEALGLVREQVMERNPKKFVANIDHLGFLYDEIEPAFYGAKANRYKVVVEPQRMIYNKKPTPYTYCIVMSPDNFQIELQQEDGRTSARKIYKNVQK